MRKSGAKSYEFSRNKYMTFLKYEKNFLIFYQCLYISSHALISLKWSFVFYMFVPRVQREEDQSATGLLLCTHSAGSVSQTCLLRSKRRELLRAVVTLDDSTPQRRTSELRVWSYEPFIVPASSSSGYLSGQNLEVLYIIRNII